MEDDHIKIISKIAPKVQIALHIYSPIKFQRMAKSNSFFGLRRGSTKSLTFQVLDGKQITKDRVTEVSNPKSNGQIMQRMKLAASVNIYRYFKGFIDRGQQGISYGKKSRQAWMKSILSGEPMYAPKGSTVLLPWTFPITKGTLTPFVYNYAGESNLRVATEGQEGEEELIATDEILLQLNPQLQDGDQITVIVMSQASSGNYNIYSASKIIGDGTQIQDVLMAANIDIAPLTQGENTVAVFQALTGTVAGCAIILSRLNGSVYERSTQTFQGDPTVFTDAFCQLAADTFRDKSQITHDWPEVVEGGFIPFGHGAVYVQHNGTGYNALTVFGFAGNEYRLLGVTGDGTSEGNLYRSDGTQGTIGADDAKVGVGTNTVDAGDYFSGYLSIQDYNKFFG